MRKQNIGFLFDKILWFIIYTLPIWTWLIYASKGFTFNIFDINNVNYGEDIVFGQVVFQFAGALINNPIFSVFSSIFGVNGPIQLDSNGYGIICYFCYFITCVIAHILVDVLLFIPRYCHKMIRKGEDYVED